MGMNGDHFKLRLVVAPDVARPDEADELPARTLLFWRRPLWSCSAKEFIKAALRSAFGFIALRFGCTFGEVIRLCEVVRFWRSFNVHKSVPHN